MARPDLSNPIYREVFTAALIGILGARRGPYTAKPVVEAARQIAEAAFEAHKIVPKPPLPSPPPPPPSPLTYGF